MSEFLAMGGYALYVWGAWGVALLVLGWLVVSSVLRWREAERSLAVINAGRRKARRHET